MSIQNISNQKQTQKTLDFRNKYKTEKCRFWFEKGFCPFNKFCAFAHTQFEMREKKELNERYKTKLCHNFFQNGFCKYGDRCQYIHKSFSSQRDGQKTRSNSQQSYSSRSSTQSQSVTKNNYMQEIRHQAKLEMLKEKDFGLFQIMMGSKSRINEILGWSTSDSQQGLPEEYEVEYYCGLGNQDDKKYRLYSL